MATWKQDVIDALSALGGEASLKEINERVKEIRTEKLPKTWTAIIRETIESHSSDSIKYNKRENIFYSVNGIGKGIWGLHSYKNK